MKIQCRYMTLIEIMVVMALIGIISAVLLYNVGGSLQKGKIFATECKIKKLEQVLMLHIAEGADKEKVLKEWQALALEDPLLRGKEDPTTDAWGKKFTVEAGEYDGIVVISEELNTRKKATVPNSR